MAESAGVSAPQQHEEQAQTNASQSAHTHGASAPAEHGSSVAEFREVANQYGHELVATCEALRQRAIATQTELPNQVNAYQSTIELQTREIINAILNTEGPVTANARGVTQTFLWSSMLLLTAATSIPIGSKILAPITELFLGKTGAALLAYIVLPIVASYTVAAATREIDGRFTLLAISGIQGALIGFVLQNSYIYSQPLAALTPLIYASMYVATVDYMRNSRANQLAAIFATAVGINGIIGLVTVGLSTPYLLLTLDYAAIAGVTLQLLHHTQFTDKAIHQLQLIVLAVSMLCHGFAHLLLGGAYSPPPSH